MPRLIAILALVGAAVAAAFVFAGAREDEERYKVRAIFDNAGFVIPGEDVKVAGVKVGTIDAVEVTPDHKAAVVLDIEDPGFQDFRSDARCQVRPQSLIGERFVECWPTRRRAVGSEPPARLRRIGDGAGEGQYLLPVEQTTKSVDLDLINNIYRLPYRQRLSVIINEFGTALAGRGADLNQVIRRANPAMRELQEVLGILAEQNESLQRLATDSDRALEPLARERRRVSRFVESAADLGQATVERRAELEGSFRRFPRFLRELRPTMRELGAFAEQASPALADLGDAAPELNTFLRTLGPFSQAALPAFDTLGDAGRVGVEALEASRPVIRQTSRLSRELQPVGRQLADVLTSFERNDGIERFMDFLFYSVAAGNGFDEFGHYLRANLLVNTCSTYTTTPIEGCSANFTSTATATAASGKPRDPVLARTAEVLRGADPASVLDAEGRRRVREETERLTRSVAQGGAAARKPPAPAPSASAPAAPPATSGDTDAALLDYLFGGDAP